jgi:hypothetical protein
MTNRERVLKAVQCEAVDRIPWAPFSGCHFGALIGAHSYDRTDSPPGRPGGEHGRAVRRLVADSLAPVKDTA